MKTLLQPLREKVLTGQVLNESLKAAEDLRLAAAYD